MPLPSIYRTTRRQDRAYAPAAWQIASPATDAGAQPACQDHDPEIFFPVGQSLGNQHTIAESKRICGGCPLRVGCLEYATEHNIIDGTWGGLTEWERSAVRRRQVTEAVRRGKINKSVAG